MTIEVVWIKNYGGYREQNIAGGSAVEFFAVFGCGPNEIEAAQSANPPLPKKGSVHPDPRFAPGTVGSVGTVQSVRQVQICGPLSWIAMVRYSVGGTFNFGTFLGGTVDTDIESLRVPILLSLDQLTGNQSDHTKFITPNPPTHIPRYCITKRVSTRGGSSTLDQIAAITAENIGKVYEFDGIEYQLAGAPSMQDAGNNIRVDTRFRHRGPVPEFAVGAIGDNGVLIPALPPNGDYVVNMNSAAPITVTDPAQTLGQGGVLPWL